MPPPRENRSKDSESRENSGRNRNKSFHFLSYVSAWMPGWMVLNLVSMVGTHPVFAKGRDET
jgi:hypothetical protein